MFSFTAKFRLLVLIFLSIAFSVQAQTSEPQASLTAEQAVEKGFSFAKEKQFDKAVELFKQAIKLNPDLASAYHGLSYAYVSMGRIADAVEPIKAAVRLDPNNAAYRVNLAYAYAAMRHPDDAMSELNIAKQLSPNDARIYLEIGNVLHNGFGRIQDALAMYLESRRLDPGVATVHHNIGLMYMRLGKFSNAIAPLEEALRLDPQYKNARYLLSDAYNFVGRYNDAAESWSKFLLLVPNGPEALTKRSWTRLYEGGHGREAAADAQTFLKTYGWKDQTSGYLAIMANIGYRQAGMNEEAQTVISEAAKKINPDIWAYNIIRYLKDDISGDELLRLATDNDKKTEAHAYLGMDLLLKEKNDEAQTHFVWVKEYGNKRFFEYPLAVEELKRLGK